MTITLKSNINSAVQRCVLLSQSFSSHSSICIITNLSNMGVSSSKTKGSLLLGKQHELHIDGSGKTSILFRLQMGKDHVTETLDNQQTDSYMFGGRMPMFHSVNLTVAKTPHAFIFWQLYDRQPSNRVQAVIYCVDSSDRDSMDGARAALNTLLQEENLKGRPLLVYANKQDISGSMTAKEVEEALQLDIIKGRLYHVQGCSALSGAGLWEGLEWFVRRRQRTDEKREAVQGPVKETLEDGKTMLKSGHSWIGNLFTRATATTS